MSDYPPDYDEARYHALAERAEDLGLQVGLSQGLDGPDGGPVMYRLRRLPAAVPTLDALAELIDLEERMTL